MFFFFKTQFLFFKIVIHRGPIAPSQNYQFSHILIYYILLHYYISLLWPYCTHCVRVDLNFLIDFAIKRHNIRRFCGDRNYSSCFGTGFLSCSWRDCFSFSLYWLSCRRRRRCCSWTSGSSSICAPSSSPSSSSPMASGKYDTLLSGIVTQKWRRNEHCVERSG